MKEPFFLGRDNYDQLVRIAKVLGTDGLVAYLEKYDLELDSNFDGIMVRQTRLSLRPCHYVCTSTCTHKRKRQTQPYASHTHTHTHTHTRTHSLLQGRYTRKPWKKFVTDKNRDIVSDDGIALLDSLLQYDHAARPTCAEAMQQPFFDVIRREEAEKTIVAGGGAKE
jgi:casein kinase II subunit alpha